MATPLASLIAAPSAQLASLESRIALLRARLAAHPLYASLRTLDDVHRFMEAHVFAVWDFMSLLKALQRGLTSVEVPWLPSAQPEARRLNHQLDGRLSTFLWYLERHIEVDGEDHGPMALRMVSELCGEDEKKWEEAREAAEFALRSRLRLWDALASSPTSHHP